MAEITTDINTLNEQIEQLFPELQIDIRELFSKLLQGKVTDVLKKIFENFAHSVQVEFVSMKEILIMLLCIGILAALILNITSVFGNHQIMDMGFYFVYLFLVLLLIKIFETTIGTAEGLMENILLCMKLVLPVYFLAVGSAAGVTTALVYYQFVLFLIYAVEFALWTFLLPVMKSFVFLVFMNGLWPDERLHMLLDFVKRMLGYCLKIAFSVVTGIGMIQSMIAPVIDSLKMNAFQKAVSAIPGIGGFSGSVAEMAVGSAVLIKNSTGVLAVLLLFMLCVVPVIKIWMLAMILKCGAAVSGVISDRRITSCMDETGEAGILVLRTILTCIGFFLVMIAIISMTTNRGF